MRMRNLFVILVCVVFLGGCVTALAGTDGVKAPVVKKGIVKASDPTTDPKFKRDIITINDDEGKPILYFVTFYDIETKNPAKFYILDRDKKIIVGK